MTLGRIWALQVGALAGVAVPDELPASWREAARSALGREPPERVRQEDPPQADAGRRAAADRQGLEAVARARELLPG